MYYFYLCMESENDTHPPCTLRQIRYYCYTVDMLDFTDRGLANCERARPPKSKARTPVYWTPSTTVYSTGVTREESMKLNRSQNYGTTKNLAQQQSHHGHPLTTQQLRMLHDGDKQLNPSQGEADTNASWCSNRRRTKGSRRRLFAWRIRGHLWQR